MILTCDGAGPKYQQIYRALRDEILSGRLAELTQLPSTRTLAREAGVSRNTVLQAYEQLLAEGYVTGQVGSGTFVTSNLPDSILGGQNASSPPQRIAQLQCGLSAYATRAQIISSPVMRPPSARMRYDFRYGLPSVADFPFELWRKLLTRHARNSAIESLSYGTAEGRLALRQAIADYLRRSRGVECEAAQVVVVNGSQQALDLVARALLDPNDVVAIEDPHYPGAREVFLAAGARLAASPVDGEGLSIVDLPPEARRARLVYVTPSHQFPTGVVMSLSRRLALLAWARDTGSYVVEDDYDSEYRFDTRPIQAVQGLDRSGHVIYIGTLSKTFFPGLRVGYLVLPRPLVRPIRTLKYLSDRHTPSLQQDALADFITEGHFDRHLRRACRRNGQRRAALLGALEREFGSEIRVDGANAGLHMLVWFPSRKLTDTDAMVARAEKAQVGIYPIAPYYLGKPPSAGFVLGYAALEETAIDKGIKLLAGALS